MAPPARWTGEAVGPDKVNLMFTVSLPAEADKPLGITVGGGKDEMLFANDPGFYVSHLPEGTEGASAVLEINDGILSINGQALEGMEHDEAIAAMVAAKKSGTVTLLIRRAVPADSPSHEEYFYGRHGYRDEAGAYVAGTLEDLTANTRSTIMTKASGGGYGLAMTGTAKDRSTDGVFVAAVIAGGAAAATKVLQRGHQIVEVNGWNTTMANHNEIQAIFQTPGTGSASITVATDNAAGFQEFVNVTFQAFYSPSLPPGGDDANCGPLRKIVLPRKAGQSLGFVLCGPPSDQDIGATGVFVSDIHEGGLVHQDNRLRVEDEILEINGQALTGATLPVAAAALAADGEVSLLVQSNPDGYKFFSEQSLKAEAAANDAAAAAAPAAAAAAAETEATATTEAAEAPAEEAAAPAEAVRTAELKRGLDESFGFGIIGGEDAGAQDGGVFVSVVNDGGVAQAAGTVNLGDEVVEIDGKPLAGMKHDSVAGLISGAGETLSLGLRKNSQGFKRHQSDLRCHGGLVLDNSNVRLVELQGDANGLGFECRGYDSALGPKPVGVFVSKASAESGLKVGDQILEVSGSAPGEWKSVRYASAEDTINAIVQAKAAGKACITVVQNLAGYAFHSNVVASGGFAGIFGEIKSLEEPGAEGAEGAEESVVGPTMDLSAFPELPFFVRTHFSQAAGDGKLGFSTGDVLEVSAIIDGNCWMASSVASGAVGTVPSRSAYEHQYRDSDAWAEHTARADAVAKTVSASRTRTVHDARMEAMQVHSYDVVEKRTATSPRPVAIYGAFSEVVFSKVAKALGEYELAQPVRSTTRPMRDGEQDGVTYNFVTKDDMEAAMDNNAVVEVGSFRDNYYGTTVTAVTEPLAEGKLVVLTVQPPAIRRLQSIANVHPVVVFVDGSATPTTCDAASDPQTVDAEVRKAADQDSLYRHVFTDRVSLGASLDDAVAAAAAAVKAAVTGDYWATVPNVVLPQTQPEDEGEHVTHDFKTCLVSRNEAGKFGFSVSGGLEDGGLPSVVITGAQPKVVGGDVVNGDMILRINEKSAVGVPHNDLVNMVASSGDVVRLTLVPPLKGLRSVRLKKSKKSRGYGFSLVTHEDLIGRRVRDVVPRSPAALANLKEGDCIVAVNGKPLLHATHSDMLVLLRSNQEVSLLVADPPPNVSKGPLRGYNVVLAKSPATGYGLRVGSNPEWEYPEIEAVVPGTAAAACGKLFPGQKILAINHHSMKKADHAYVLAALQSSSKVSLQVAANQEIVLSPNSKGFGMSIVFDEATPNGYPLVGNIVPGGAADECGMLHPGDEIVELNGRSTKGLGEGTIFARLTERPTLSLVVVGANGPMVSPITAATAAAIKAAEETLVDRRSVTLERGAEGLGLIIANDDGSVWTKICDLVPGTPGAEAGININDVLISVNGESMVGLSHNQVVAALTEKTTVELEVAKARRKVEIDNSERAFGLRILGAASKEMFPVVSNVNPDSASAVAHMQPGSHIFSINGVDMRGAIESEIVAALQKSEDHLVVMVTTLEPPTFDEDLLHNVRGALLTRGPSGLGIQFVTDDAESFSVITKVFEGSPAKESGVIFENDVIVKINGAYMTNKSHEEIADAMMASPTVNLIVADHPNPGSTYEGASMVTPLGGPRTVTVPKGDSGYGLQFATYPPEENKLPTIVEVIKGGSAAGTECHAGDTIIEVNGTPCRGLDHDAVVGLIKAGSDSVTLMLLHQVDASAMAEAGAGSPHAVGAGSPHAVDADTAVNLAKSAPNRPKRVTSLRRKASGYGVKMTSVDGMSHPVVTGIVEGTSAHEAGSIHPGDVILEINGESIDGLSHEDVVKKFTAKDTVDLLIASGDHARDHVSMPADGPGDASAAVDTELAVGKRVFVVGYEPQGTVRFVGNHHIQGTPRALVQLDKPVGKNNGTIKGNAYCDTLPDKTGVLVIPGKVFVVPASCPAAAVLRTVPIERKGGPMGLKLETGDELGQPTTIIEVNEGGAAIASGLVSVGDQIVTINGDIVYGVDHEAVLKAIQASPDTVEFGLFGVPPGASTAAPVAGEPAAAAAFDLADYPYRNTLVLSREPGQRIGMSLSSVEGQPVSVIDITEGALVHESQMCSVGDVVFSVNGADMLPAKGASSEDTHTKCVTALSGSGALEIVFASKKEACRVANLVRGSSGLGMKISSVDGVFRVSEVVPGGVAEETKAVVKGDRIVSINGQSTAGKSHDDVVGMLTSTKNIELKLVPDASELPAIEDPAAAAPADAPTGGEFDSVVNALTEASKEKVVKLKRGNSGLGMKISSLDTVFRVSDVVAGGPAESTEIAKGDRILKINGTATENKNHDEVVGLLTAQSDIELVLLADDSPLPEVDEPAAAEPAAEPSAAEPATEPAAAEPAAEPEDLREATITKPEGGGLGLKISSLDGVFRISGVVDGGAAASCDQLKVGDVILSVNGTETTGLSHDEVVALLVKNNPVALKLKGDDSPLPAVEDAAAAPAPAPAPATKTCTLDRSGGASLGMKISSMDNVFRVSMVIPGGTADKAGSIVQGDRIMTINGTATADKTHEDVVALLTGEDLIALELVADDSPLPAES